MAPTLNMRIAIHSELWSDRFDSNPEVFLEKTKKLGFEGIEIYISPRQLQTFDKGKVIAALRKTGLECIGGTSLDAETDITSQDEKVRRRGIDCLCNLSKVLSELGGHLVTGTTYIAIGKMAGRGRTKEEWDHAVEGLKEACRAVRDYGVTIGIEPLNRFQTYFLNTATEAIRLAEEVAEPNIGVHLDTFHMNIEEKNFYDPIKRTGPLLCHVHCSENDRDIVGSGNVEWNEVFKALTEIKYDKWISLAAFTPHSGTSVETVWRQMAPSAEALASESIAFMKTMLRKYQPS